MFPPLSRHLDAAAAGSTDDGYLSDKSTPHPPTSSSSSPLSSAGYTDDTCPDMETMMAVEDEAGSEDDEVMEEDYPAASVPGTPTSLMPTIDQLFKRSFTQELEQLTSSSSCHSHSSHSSSQLPDDLIMRTSESDQQLVILEDIQQILRDEANFELCV
jgi:hypothetical protein